MEQGTIKIEETRKQPSRLEVIGAVITVGVLRWAPCGVPGSRRDPMVNNLEELISR